MAPPQRKTTARLRYPLAYNEPMVEIKEGDITDTIRENTPADDISSAFDIIKELWRSRQVDYVAAVPVPNSHGSYLIYTPEKGVGHPDPSVLERMNTLERTARTDFKASVLDGVYIDTVRCPEDSYDLRIAKIVVRRP